MNDNEVSPLDVQDALAKILSKFALCIIALPATSSENIPKTKARLDAVLSLSFDVDRLVALFVNDDNRFGENVPRDFEGIPSFLDDSFFGGFTKED